MAAGWATTSAMQTDAFSSPSAPDSAPPRSSRITAVLVIATFLVVNATGISVFRAVAGDLDGWPRMLALAVLGYGPYLAAPLAVAALLCGPRGMWSALGLAASPWRAFAFAGACSAIVLVGIAAAAAPMPVGRIPLEIVRSAVLPGIAEEVLFRGFLFGFLYRFAGWGFLPAALLSSLVFGLEHVYQGGDPAEALGIAVLTGVGGVWWSWLLVEWRWNLWVPIAFHVLLNAYWTAFDVADNALGSTMTIVLRLLCIGLSIAVTVALAKRHGGLQVSGRRWLRGP